MMNRLTDLPGVTGLSKTAQKRIVGGATAGGNCGNILTLDSGYRCLVGGIPKAVAIQASAAYNQGDGIYNAGGYGGAGITDVNWCCASCGNFAPCNDMDA